MSHQRPNHPVSQDSVSKWVWSAMDQSGDDTSIFKLYSTDGASVGKAAGWYEDQCFAKFYLKKYS